MSDETKVVSDDNAAPSGESERQTVSYETHKKMLSQRKADQVKITEMSQQLAEIKAEREASAEQALVDQNNWKQIAEQKELKLSEAEQKLSSINDSLVRAEKIDAFQKELGAELKHRDFSSHINVDSILISDSGEIDADSLNVEINRFRENYGDSLLKTNTIPTVPGGAPSKSEPKGINDLSSLERAELRKMAVSKL